VTPPGRWAEVRELLAELASLDRQGCAFGARRHRHRFNPVATAAEVALHAERIGLPQPEQLSWVYRHVGDGGAGPHYGLAPLAQLSRPPPGIARLAAAAKARMSARGSAFVDAPSVAQLLVIGDAGCGQDVCIFARGARCGSVIVLSEEGQELETSPSLDAFYLHWLARLLPPFRAMKALVQGELPLDELLQACDERAGFERYALPPLDVLASVIDLEMGDFPRIADADARHLWYRRRLEDWRERRLA
jgi:hypothetical protein